jgi:hypothetical protein
MYTRLSQVLMQVAVIGRPEVHCRYAPAIGSPRSLKDEHPMIDVVSLVLDSFLDPVRPHPTL